jgi:hypothetical protein
MRWVGIYEGHKMCIQGLAGETWWKQTIGRPRNWWEGKIKIDIQEVGWTGIDQIALVQDRERCCVLVKVVVHLQVP